jgi:hypothetical protein
MGHHKVIRASKFINSYLSKIDTPRCLWYYMGSGNGGQVHGATPERRDAMNIDLVNSIIKQLTALIPLLLALKPLFGRKDRQKPPKG